MKPTLKHIRLWLIHQRGLYNNNLLNPRRRKLLEDAGFDFTNQLTKDVLPFEEARRFVQSLNLKNQDAWKNWFVKNKPINLPCNPDRKYNTSGWLSYPDWLGTQPGFDGTYLSYDEAKQFVHPLKIKSSTEWITYCRSGKKPHNIPFAPQQTYIGKRWISFGDFLGTGVIATFNMTYRQFKSARTFAQQLKLKTGKEWTAFCDSGKLPSDIPAAPWHTYKNDGYVSMGDWLGTGSVANYHKKYVSFSEAKTFALKQKFNNNVEWKSYIGDNQLFQYPSHPDRTYKSEWKGWGDFLGTGNMGPLEPFEKKYLSFVEAREVVRKLGLKNKREWDNLKDKPDRIPIVASNVYKNRGWTDWYDFLGNNPA